MPPVAGYRHGFRRPAIRAALADGATTVNEVADRVGLAPRTVHAHLVRMRADHEVRRVDDGRGNTGARWALRASAARAVHPSVCTRVAEWLDDAALDASDDANHRNPHLAQAFRDLADSVRQQAGSPHRGEAANNRRQAP